MSIPIERKPVPPLPPSRRSPEVEAAFKMEVGDSITVPYERKRSQRAHMARATGFNFTQRVEGDKITIWRVEDKVNLQDDKEKGLYDKFFVRRKDGSSEIGERHYGCEYFVIDLTHDPIGRAAMVTYADLAMEKGYDQLAKDIYAKLGATKVAFVEALNAKEKEQQNERV